MGGKTGTNVADDKKLPRSEFTESFKNPVSTKQLAKTIPNEQKTHKKKPGNVSQWKHGSSEPDAEWAERHVAQDRPDNALHFHQVSDGQQLRPSHARAIYVSISHRQLHVRN